MLNSKSVYEQQSQAYKHFIFHQYPQSLQLYTQCLKNPTLQPVAQFSIEAVMSILHMQMHNYTQAHQILTELEEKLNVYISKFSQLQRKQSYMQSLLIYIKVKICLILIQMLNCNRSFVEQHLQDIFKLIKSVDETLKKKLWASVMLMLFGVDSFEQLYRTADCLVSNLENQNKIKPQLSQQSPLLLTCLSLVIQLANNNQLAYQIQYHCHQNLCSQLQPQIISLLISCKHMIHLCEILGYHSAKQSYKVQFNKLMNTPQIYGINQQTLFRGYNQKIEIGKWIVQKLMNYESMVESETRKKMNQMESKQAIFIKWVHNKVIYKLEKLLYEIESNPKANPLIEKENLIHTLHCLSSKNGYQILSFMLESQLVKNILSEEEDKVGFFVGRLRKIFIAHVWRDLIMLPPRVSHKEQQSREAIHNNTKSMGLTYDYKVFKNRNQHSQGNQKGYNSANPYQQELKQKYRKGDMNLEFEKNNFMTQGNLKEQLTNHYFSKDKQQKKIVELKKGNQNIEIIQEDQGKVSNNRRKNNFEGQDYSRDEVEQRETSRSRVQLNQRQKQRRKVEHVNVIQKSPIKHFNYKESSNSPYERQKKFETNNSHLTVEKNFEGFEEKLQEYHEQSELINIRKGKNDQNLSKMGSHMNNVYLDPEKSRIMRPFEQYLDEGEKASISNYNSKVGKNLHPKFERRDHVKNDETGNEQKIMSILKSQNSRVKQVSQLQKQKIQSQKNIQAEMNIQTRLEQKKISVSKNNQSTIAGKQQLEKVNNQSKLSKFTNIFTDPAQKNSPTNSNFNFNQQGELQKPTLTYTNSTVLPLAKINKQNISKDINFLKKDGSNIVSKIVAPSTQKLTAQTPLIRKLMKICSEGQYFVKRHYSSDGGEMKFVQLTTNMLKWGVDQEKIATKFQSYKLKDIKGLVYGKVTDTFLKQCNQKLSSWLCFSLILQSRTLDFYCTDQVDPSIWLPGLTAALAGQTITLKYPKNKRKKTQEKVQEIEVKLFTPGRVLWKRVLMKIQQKYVKPLKKHQKGSKCPNARAILLWHKQFLKNNSTKSEKK